MDPTTHSKIKHPALYGFKDQGPCISPVAKCISMDKKITAVWKWIHYYSTHSSLLSALQLGKMIRCGAASILTMPCDIGVSAWQGHEEMPGPSQRRLINQPRYTRKTETKTPSLLTQGNTRLHSQKDLWSNTGIQNLGTPKGKFIFMKSSMSWVVLKDMFLSKLNNTEGWIFF